MDFYGILVTFLFLNNNKKACHLPPQPSNPSSVLSFDPVTDPGIYNQVSLKIKKKKKKVILEAVTGSFSCARQTLAGSVRCSIRHWGLGWNARFS